jgi:hypothetical protein
VREVRLMTKEDVAGEGLRRKKAEEREIREKRM